MRRLFVLAALPLLAACITPWSSIGGEEVAYNVLDPAAPTVAVLGDSLTVQARLKIHLALEPEHSAKLAAYQGEGYAGGPFTAQMQAPEPALVDVARRMALDPPDVLVLALGTNDVWHESVSLETATAWMQTVLGVFPDACVVGTTLNDWGSVGGYDIAKAAAWNAQLPSFVDVVVPWDSIGEEVGITQPSSVHLTALGDSRYASEIAAGVEACGEEPPPTTTTTIGE